MLPDAGPVCHQMCEVHITPVYVKTIEKTLFTIHVFSHLLVIHHFDSVMLTVTRNESDRSVPVTVIRHGYIQRESTVLIQPVIGSPPNAAGNRDYLYLSGQLSSQYRRYMNLHATVNIRTIQIQVIH